jgi:2'-5' RNA ligase
VPRNWFIALPVPAAGWFEQLVANPPLGVRRFHPDDLHLTIAFLGSVSPEAAARGFAAVKWPAATARVTLGEVVPMGPPRRYSALSAVLRAGARDVTEAIAATRAEVLRAAGRPLEEREPRAHVTVARPQRQASGAQRAAGRRWAESLGLEGVELMLGRPALYTSADDAADPSGRRYRIVESQGGASDRPGA